MSPPDDTEVETLSGHDAVLVFDGGARSWSVTVAPYDLEGVAEIEVVGFSSQRSAHAAAEQAGQALTIQIQSLADGLRDRHANLTRLSADLALVVDDRIRGSLVSDALGQISRAMTSHEAREAIRQGIEDNSLRLDDADAVLAAAAVAQKARARQRRCTAIIQVDGAVFHGNASTWHGALDLALGCAEIDRPNAFPTISPDDVYLVPSRTILTEMDIDLDQAALDDVSHDHRDAVLGALGQMPRARVMMP